MKNLLVIVLAVMLSGCSMFGKGMTRLLPKIEKIDLPEELMKPPQELKIIVKPDKPPVNDDKNASTPQAELERNVSPK